MVLLSCDADKGTPDVSSSLNVSQMMRSLSSEKTGIDFINLINNTKEFNIFNYRNFYNGGGVGIGDINNDGLPDVYLTSNLGENKLYLNEGGLTFKDISEQAGILSADKWSTGVSMVDLNADGYLDIYVCNAGNREGGDQKNQLYINNHDLTFTEQAADYGLDESGYTTHAAFFDYDKDGDLDVYILNNSFIPVNTLNYSNKRTLRAEDWPVKDFLKGGGDKLLANEGGKFVDVSERAGIYGSLIGFGLGVTVGDLNGDNYEDIYVSNDFFERDYLYINNRQGGFDEELEERINHLSHSSMGADIADINNDGAPEIFVTDMLPDDDYRLKTTSTFDNITLRNLKLDKGFYNQFMHNTLQLNDGQGQFKEISFYGNVDASDWSWGALMYDVDNDGWNDIYVCNGIINDVIDQDFIQFFANEVIQKMVLTGEKEAVDSIINVMPSVPLKNKLFLNAKGMKFSDVSTSAGIDEKTFSNGAAYGDLDGDGDLDLVVNNNNQLAQVYENLSQNNHLSVTLSYKDGNQDAIGAKVFLYSEMGTQIKEMIPYRGFQSSVDKKLVFGCGQTQRVDSLRVIWPDQKTSILRDIEVNSALELSYEDATDISTEGTTAELLFSESELLNFSHVEDDYVDFFYERNIPMQLSKEGPCHATGDVNADGILDLYLGASAGSPSQILLGTKTGFVPTQEDYMDVFKAMEDNCATFADIDGDGDQDLLVGSGGNNVTYAKRAFRDRAYFNENGRYEIRLNALPPKTVNTSCIKPHDIDADGDLDLFVGARSVPGEYGLSPGSYIYMNNGKGQYLDVTEQVQPELKLAGMITDAIWADVLPGNDEELILVGEWMAPKILAYSEGELNIVETALSEQSGWWQTVETIDVDADGDLDLLLGNIGENFYLDATHDEPLILWINDFDDNGSIEKLITKRRGGKDYPVMVKSDLASQLPGINKQSLRHSEYAEKSIDALFPMQKLQSSTIKQINTMSSMIAMNDGQGNFEMRRLNDEAQLSCINAFAVLDLDEDGDEDVVCAGNNHYLLPQFSLLDASRGEVLINDGGALTYMDPRTTGLNLQGTVRELAVIDKNGKKNLLAMINNQRAKLLQLNKR